MLKHHSHWYLSGNSKNDTNFVYALQKYFMQHIKDQFPFITNVEYFTSRYAGQYKNYNIPLPLCYHEIDFEMQVQWLFFATSHRKSPPNLWWDWWNSHVPSFLYQPSTATYAEQILSIGAIFELCCTYWRYFDILNSKAVSNKFSVSLGLIITIIFHQFIQHHYAIKISVMMHSMWEILIWLFEWSYWFLSIRNEGLCSTNIW